MHPTNAMEFVQQRAYEIQREIEMARLAREVVRGPSWTRRVIDRIAAVARGLGGSVPAGTAGTAPAASERAAAQAPAPPRVFAADTSSLRRPTL